MKKLILLLSVVLFVLLSHVSLGANCGGSTPCNCGDTLVESQTMWYDLNNCPSSGLIISVDGITLDCNNHLIDGDGGVFPEAGIRLKDKEGFILKNCKLQEFYYGIDLENSYNTILANNTVNNNNRSGIQIYNCFNNMLTGNTVNNSNEAILLSNCFNSTLTKNTADHGSRGIYLMFSSYNTLINNTANSNMREGIGLIHSYNNILSKNSADKNDDIGIELFISSNNTLMDNSASGNGKGIGLAYSAHYNTLSGNVVNNNGKGIYLAYSTYNQITNNTLFENRPYGADLEGSQYNTFWNNNFSDNPINADEDNSATDNHWNLSDVGNYWSDFFENPGYPFYYNVSGPGDGIDWHPFWINSPPVLDPIGDQIVLENMTLSIDINATDLNNDTLTYATNAYDVLPSAFSFDSINGLFVWTPTYADAGNYSLLFNVTDGYSSDEEIITIEVINVNRPPMLEPIDDIIVNETDLITIIVSASDPDNDVLNYVINDSRFAQNENVFTWNTSYDDAGNYSVLVTVSDGEFNESVAIDISIVDLLLEFYVDNLDPNFRIIFGNWNLINHSNAYGGNTRYTNAGSGTKEAGWRVDNLVLPGVYEVSVWKFEHPLLPLMATNVHYRIYYKQGASPWIIVDLSTLGNEWIYLGDFAFDNSHLQGVLINDLADGYVIADAVRLVYKGPLNTSLVSGEEDTVFPW